MYELMRKDRKDVLNGLAEGGGAAGATDDAGSVGSLSINSGNLDASFLSKAMLKMNRLLTHHY